MAIPLLLILVAIGLAIEKRQPGHQVEVITKHGTYTFFLIIPALILKNTQQGAINTCCPPPHTAASAYVEKNHQSEIQH